MIGFIFAIFAFGFCWLPYVGGALWVLGLIFSFLGLSNLPNGIAKAGMWLSIIWVVAYIVLGICIDGVFGTFTILPYFLR